MYLTMNRFRIKPGFEEAFERIWTGRDSLLPEVPGFLGFHLLRGEKKDGYTLYASHTMWESEAAFAAWTRSEAFRAAHAGAGASRDIYFGAPELEVFTSVQQID